MEVVAVVATFGGIISVAKELTDVARELAEFYQNFKHAKKHIDQYHAEVVALEVIQLSIQNTMVTGSAVAFLNHHFRELQSMVNDLRKHKDGMRARLHIAWKDDDLRQILNVVERAKTTMQLVLQLQANEQQRTVGQDVVSCIRSQHEIVAMMSQLYKQSSKTAMATLEMQEKLDSLQLQVSNLGPSSETTLVRQVEECRDIASTRYATFSPTGWLCSLQHFLCSFQERTIRGLACKPQFRDMLHESDSHVATALKRGNRHEIVRLLKTGEMHPVHAIDGYAVGFTPMPLYLFAGLYHGTEISQALLDYSIVEASMVNELMETLSWGHAACEDGMMTDLFKRLISTKGLDDDLVQARKYWMGEVAVKEWFDIIHLRAEGLFQPVEDLLRLDPSTILHENLHARMTVHGIAAHNIHRLAQEQKDWLLHAFLAEASDLGRDAGMVQYLLYSGADPDSVVHGRGPLATIFVSTRLEDHLHHKGRSISIFSLWANLLALFGLDFEECYEHKQVFRECTNKLQGHTLNLVDINADGMKLEVTWTWKLYTKSRLPGLYDHETNNCCWDFKARGQFWQARTKTFQYAHTVTFEQLLDHLGYQHPIPPQDDHDWMCTRLPVQWARATLKRRHSEPRPLRGLKWIPHPGRDWLLGYLISPFTGEVSSSFESYNSYLQTGFPAQLGCCLGLHDYVPYERLKHTVAMPDTSAASSLSLSLGLSQMLSDRPSRKEVHPMIRRLARDLQAEAKRQAMPGPF